MPNCAACGRTTSGGITFTSHGITHPLCDRHAGASNGELLAAIENQARSGHWISLADFHELERLADGLQRELDALRAPRVADAESRAGEWVDLSRAREQIEQLRAELARKDEELAALKELLAVCSHDGGHYAELHGITRACRRAKLIVVRERQESGQKDRRIRSLEHTIDVLRKRCGPLENESIIETVEVLRQRIRELELSREPSQAEGEAAAGDADECFVTGWTGRRCLGCAKWVWGGPTRCEPCVADEADTAELQSNLARAVEALERLNSVAQDFHDDETRENRGRLGSALTRARTVLQALKGKP